MEKKLTAEIIADKVFELTEQFNQYVFAHPEILDHIPDKALLVFLDADDSTFNQANLEVVNAMTQPPDRPIVYIQMQKWIRMVERIEWKAQVLLSPQLEFA